MFCPGTPRTDAGRRCGGFTLFEVLLVIALIAVAATMAVVSVNAIGRTSAGEEMEAAFWDGVALAREQALSSRRPVELRFDPQVRHFVVATDEVLGTVAVPANPGSKDTPWEVEFTRELPSNDFVLVRGQLVTRRKVGAVRFFPDGTCQAFAVEFTSGSTKRLLTIDPWTGAPLLTGDEGKPGKGRL